MDSEMFKNIEGYKLICEKIPNFSWFHFSEILEFRWYRQFDNEEWYERSYFEMKMGSCGEKDIVLFKFKDAEFVGDFSIKGWIAGFDIFNRTKEYQVPKYEIMDFEDGAIHMLCSDFSVELIKVNGINI